MTPRGQFFQCNGQIYRRVMQGFFDGNGGMRVAWAWRLHKTYKTYKTYKMMVGAPLYNPWVCMPLSGLARAKIYRRGML